MTTGMNVNMNMNMNMNMMQEQQNVDKQIQKQMGGCMAGFFHLFDRHHLLTGKRLTSPKRLPPSPPSPPVDAKSETETTNVSDDKQQQPKMVPSPDRVKQIASPKPHEPRSPAPEPLAPGENPTKSPLLPVFELKQGTRSSWKFAKEAPRLSLDSRAIVDAKGSLHPREIRTNNATAAADNVDDTDKQRRSPSVIARLMGLETLNNNASDSDNDNNSNNNNPQLRRSASESRVNKEFFNYQFIDPNSFKLKQTQSQQQQQQHHNLQNNNAGVGRRKPVVDLKEYNVRNVRAEQCKVQNRGVLQRKSFFDSADFFPEPKQSVSIYGEIEKRLKMRGIDEPSKDLESLKQILEALQLKGLLHSKNNQRNLVYERNESSIVLMKPGKSRPDSPTRRPTGARRNPNDGVRSHNVNRGRTSSPTRSESSVKSPNRRRPLSVETQRRVNETTEQRRGLSSPVQSPRISPRRTMNGPDSRSPRHRRPTAEIYHKEKLMFCPTEDESSTMSDSVSTCSQTDTERSKAEEYREGGRSLLERCDKLLHSIAEMTSAELQPSPVSVLDSSFYNEESSPSPVMKRSIEFKDQSAELEDEIWSPTLSEDNREDGDFAYISEVLRAWKYLPEDSDVFSLLEKRQHLKGRDTSKISTLQRKLIFDTINEILDRKKQIPPWKAISGTSSSSSPLEQIWSEYQRIRERDTSEDLFEVICGVLKKDLAGDAINGWGDCPVEMSEAVLDIERLIFKDLIGETIRDLAAFSVTCNKVSVSRRKLVF